MAIRVVIVALALCCCVLAKVYERCELANELRNIYKFPEEQIATWVCIARHESEYNTSAVGHMNWDNSGDHGLFQISDLYWCSPPGVGWACGVTCAQLEDDDIADDVACVKRIYRQHQRLAGDGFTAWAVYRAFCSAGASKYLEGCDDATTSVEPDVGNELTKAEEEVREHTDKEKEEVREHTDKEKEEVREHAEKKKEEVREEHAEKKTEKEAVTAVVDKFHVKPIEKAVADAGRSYDAFRLPSPKPTKKYYAKLFEYVYQP